MRDSRHEINHFWFEEVSPTLWYQSSEDFDAQIRDRFLEIYELAADGLCDGWRSDADGSLALCLVFDQFPRRMFRGEARAFATDGKALLAAKNAVAKGFDQILPALWRRFIYLPYQHSENLTDQKKGLSLFESIRQDDPAGYEQARRSHETIEKFSRFPQRSKVLGRTITPEEEEFLARLATAA